MAAARRVDRAGATVAIPGLAGWIARVSHAVPTPHRPGLHALARRRYDDARRLYTILHDPASKRLEALADVS